MTTTKNKQTKQKSIQLERVYKCSHALGWNTSLFDLDQQQHSLIIIIMSLLAIVLPLLLSVGIHGSKNETALKDGPCPTPAPMSNFKAQDFAGIWYDTYTNYLLAKVPFAIVRSCIQNKVTVESNGDWLIDTRFNNASGEYTLHKKFIPVPDKTGVYTNQVLVADGTWTDHFWTYTFVGKNGDSYLEFACKPAGEQHYSFHRMRSRSNNPPQSEFDALRESSRNDGDTDEFDKINHEDCQYSLA